MVRALRLLFLFFSTFSLLSCSGFFFYPEKELRKNPYLSYFRHEEVFFSSKDGTKLHGLFLYSDREPKATVVFFHGNAENISTHVNATLWLVMAGYDVFVFDYRGYGLSEGIPTLKGVHLDGLSAIETAYERGRSKKLVVFGQSLGASVSVYCVAVSPLKDKVKLLILDSPFADYELILRDKLRESLILYPLSFFSGLLIENTYSPLRWIEEVRPVPVVFLHGRRDRVVPYRHTLLLSEKVSWKKWVILTDAGHTLSLADPKVRTELLGIIEEAARDEHKEELLP